MIKPSIKIHEDGYKYYDLPSDEMVKEINDMYDGYNYRNYTYKELIKKINEYPKNVINDFIIQNDIIEDIKNTQTYQCKKTKQNKLIKIIMEENSDDEDYIDEIENFILTAHITEIIERIKSCVEYSTHALKVLDSRYMSCIGTLVVYIDKVFGNENKNDTEWILVSVYD